MDFQAVGWVPPSPDKMDSATYRFVRKRVNDTELTPQVSSVADFAKSQSLMHKKVSEFRALREFQAFK